MALFLAAKKLKNTQNLSYSFVIKELTSFLPNLTLGLFFKFGPIFRRLAVALVLRTNQPAQDWWLNIVLNFIIWVIRICFIPHPSSFINHVSFASRFFTKYKRLFTFYNYTPFPADRWRKIMIFPEFFIIWQKKDVRQIFSRYILFIAMNQKQLTTNQPQYPQG